MNQRLKGRIVEIEKNVHQGAYLEQGIKKQDQYKYDNNRKMHGSNGSYITDFEYYGTTIDVKILVYDLNKSYSFDIREYILGVNNMQKVSKQLLNQIIDDNKGKKVFVDISNGMIGFDMTQLDVLKK
ncbi:hypothetical protein [Paraclostridium sordellii]|uniref:hypothetical protein n=1 Tax=Paraclostridium sordellii TaxID=1505 RepID=UPI0005DB5864|nr:hypothetical protein [Paeniclostridium sordellii]CEN26173.1 Uncharacterised protein [[Clostridium] sordellii] [Paeniclostridium sordellii]